MSSNGIGLRARFERGAGNLMLALPAPLQRLLSGGRAIRIDGQELASEIQLTLFLLARSGHPSFETLPVPEARRETARTAETFAGPQIPMAQVEPVSIPGPAGDIPARFYVPAGSSPPAPLLVFYHGGGWVLCGLDSHDEACRLLAQEAGVRLLSVDYRLAPEHPFPAAPEDALAAFRWAVAESDRLGVDPDRIALAGDSAGGNLTCVVSQLALREGGPLPAFQMPFYPVTDLSKKHPSYQLFSDGFFLTEKQMDWYRGHYLPNDAAGFDPMASPLLAEDCSGLPPAHIITAGFDPLRDEGEAYARKLEKAGVEVELRRHPHLIHGFANMISLGSVCREAMREAAGVLRRALA
ncbi:MAG: alpha/beta hydrolase [bacterium]|nr:alpha/beta hydrolase [bacterium]